jgi:hypothetical protein
MIRGGCIPRTVYDLLDLDLGVPMYTTCCWCDQTDDTDLMHWARDSEGYWWHRACRPEYLSRIDDMLKDLVANEKLKEWAARRK